MKTQLVLGMMVMFWPSSGSSQQASEPTQQSSSDTPLPTPPLRRIELRVLAPEPNSELTHSSVTLWVAVRSPTVVSAVRVTAAIGDQVVAETSTPVRPEDRRGVVVSGPAMPCRTLLPDEQCYRLSLTIPNQEIALSVRAASDSESSVVVSVPLRWSKPVGARAEFLVKPKLYVLAIGISKYRDRQLDLRYAQKDAADVAFALSGQKGLLYSEVETRLLIDENASKTKILDGLEWLQRQATNRDVAMLFLAGHGINDPSTGRYYFLPHDAELSSVMRSMLSQDDIQATLKSIPGKVLLFLDTCHSGNVLGPWWTRGIADTSRFVNELSSSENGVVVFAASTGRQSSKESPEWGNGAFSRALLEAVYGAASFVKDRPITVNMLDLYLSERVKTLSGGTQAPTTSKPATMPDFPIVIPKSPVDGGKVLNFSVLPSTPPTPVYKKWWLWTAVGAIVAGATVGIVVGTWPRTPNVQHYPVTF